MAATNLTPATALDLAPLGTVVTILAADVQGAPNGTLYASTCDSTQRHALWFKYTTGTKDIMLAVGIKGAEAADAYHPVMSVWTGTPPSVAQHKVLNASAGVLNNLCASFATAVSRSDIWYFSFPVSASTTYYFQVTDANATTVTTDLHVVGVAAPVLTAAKPGDYVIINDAGPFPGAVLDQTTGTLLGYVASLANGELGAALQTGQMIFQGTNLYAGAGGSQIVNRDLTTVTTLPTTPSALLASATVFYTITFTGDTAHVQLVKPDGTLGALVDVPGVGNALMVSADSKILYYVDDVTFTTVKRWDLINNVAMTDFAGSFGGVEPGYGFISGKSQTIVIVYGTGSGTTTMRQFTDAGIVTKTDVLTHTPFNRLIGDLGSDTFQTWNGTTSFHRYGIWDPNTAIVSPTAPGAQSSNGGPQNVAYAISTSCPLSVIPSASPVAPFAFIGTPQVLPLVRKRRVPFPVLSGDRYQSIYALQLQMEKGQGNLDDADTPGHVQVKMSKDNGETWGTERSLSLGLAGQFDGRVLANLWPRARYPVVEITVSDNTNAVPTDIQALMDEGVF